MPPPSPIGIARVRVEVRQARLLVTTDLSIPSGNPVSEDIDIHVGYGGPGIPSAFDAQLLSTPKGYLVAPLDHRGDRLSHVGSKRSPSHAAFSLGRAELAGALVHVPAALLTAKLSSTGQATLRFRLRWVRHGNAQVRPAIAVAQNFDGVEGRHWGAREARGEQCSGGKGVSARYPPGRQGMAGGRKAPGAKIPLMPIRLPPTTQALFQPEARPYFLWWTEVTVGEFRALLQQPDEDERAYWLGALMREANTRDVWVFVTPRELRRLWPRLVRHLGKTRPMWAWLLGVEDIPWPPKGNHA